MNVPSVITSSPLATVLFGNPLYLWAAALAIVLIAVLAVSIVLRVGVRILRRFAGRTRSHVDDALVDALEGTQLWLVALAALRPATQILALHGSVERLVFDVSVVAFFLQFGLWAARLVSAWIAGTRARTLENDPAAVSGFGAISFVVQVAVWSLAALLALDNLGINVSALVAGLGIGGIAIGLALQNVLGDLFASLAIVLDKPFVVGDFIIVDDFKGTVENIGVKTTRLRSLDGEQLVFSNGDLTKSRLRNYKRMTDRRALFTFGVPYGTPADKVEAIPAMVRDIVEGIGNARFDRAHFLKFGDSSLDFEVVYWVLEPDFNAYADVQQSINLALLRRFAAEDIGFAFPSTSLYFEQPLTMARTRAAKD